MLNLFSRLTNLALIANYGVCGIAFVYFVNHYDTGQWNSDGWNYYLIGGLISGVLALLFERRLHQKLDLDSQIFILFFALQMVYGILFMVLTVAVGTSIAFVVSSPSQIQDFGYLGFILLLPLFIIINSVEILVLGTAAGLINGILFRGMHALQMWNRPVENP
jgi:hypothetical protein